MFAFAAMNLMTIYCLGIAAMVTAFTLPPWIAATFLVLMYIPLVSHVFISAADNSGDYRVPMAFLAKALTWVILVFAVIYWKAGLLVSGALKKVTFIDALYFSVSTWTTLVFGDLTPPASVRNITSIEALMGYVGLGLYLAVLSLWIEKRMELRKSVHDHNKLLSHSEVVGVCETA